MRFSPMINCGYLPWIICAYLMNKIRPKTLANNKGSGVFLIIKTASLKINESLNIRQNGDICNQSFRVYAR